MLLRKKRDWEWREKFGPRTFQLSHTEVSRSFQHASPWLTLTLACGFQMYIQCRVNLCITTLPSDRCPNMCGQSIEPRMMVSNLFTRTYTVNSGAVSLVVTTPAPANTAQSTQTSAQGDTATGSGGDAVTTAATTSHGKVSHIHFFVCRIDYWPLCWIEADDTLTCLKTFAIYFFIYLNIKRD